MFAQSVVFIFSFFYLMYIFFAWFDLFMQFSNYLHYVSPPMLISTLKIEKSKFAVVNFVGKFNILKFIIYN